MARPEDYKFGYLVRKEVDEIGRIRLLIINDEDEVLLREGDAFFTIRSLVRIEDE